MLFGHVVIIFIYALYKGELEHRSVKRYYARTNKTRVATQIARIHRRERILRREFERRRQSNAQVTESLRQKKISHHHHITHSRNHPLKVALWLSLRAGDPRYLVRRTEFVLKWFKHNVLYCAEFST